MQLAQHFGRCEENHLLNAPLLSWVCGLPGLVTVNRLFHKQKMIGFFIVNGAVLVLVFVLGFIVFRRIYITLTPSPPAPLPENVLASGNGRGNSAVVSTWAISVATVYWSRGASG